MKLIQHILEKAGTQPLALTHDELVQLLSLEEEAECSALFDAAYDVKTRLCGKTVAVRGLVEVGNVCAKDCLYCGIRKSNSGIARYHLSVDDVVRLAEEAKALDYGSLVLQSGEIESEANTVFFEEVLQRIAPLNLGVTLSLGEQSEEVYKRWHAAGASRYLLRIETSNAELYRTLHPANHDWTRRMECLRSLNRCGYQVGTGVMCGLPGQSVDDLAADIEFYHAIDADMIGMGPYIPHPDTPMASKAEHKTHEQTLLLGLKMIAVTRLYLHDVNIAASTALQALAEDGRERGIRAGANVVMPNVTDTQYRRRYQLYEGKPSLDENAATTRSALERRLANFGETLAYGVRGDSIHFHKKHAHK